MRVKILFPGTTDSELSSAAIHSTRQRFAVFWVMGSRLAASRSDTFSGSTMRLGLLGVRTMNSLIGRPTLTWKQVAYCADASGCEPGLVISCFVLHPLSQPHSHAILLHFPVPAGNWAPVEFYEPSCAHCSQDGTHFALLCGLQRGSRPEDRRVAGVGRATSRQGRIEIKTPIPDAPVASYSAPPAEFASPADADPSAL